MVKKSIQHASVQELQSELRRRQRRMPTLLARRKKLEQQLAEIVEQIKALGGAADVHRKPIKRARNKLSLGDMLAKTLSKTKPMQVADIVDAVKKGGYKSNSKNFASIVNQTLIKDPRFKSTGRGKYVLAK